jgi:ABC-2 type transport system permease protein
LKEKKLAEVTVFHNTAELVPVKAKGWQIGFANVFERELERVWNARTFSIQVVAWLVILNFILALFIQVEGGSGPLTGSITTFMLLAGVIAPMGAAIVASGAIIGEKKSGTAAWVLSKPVSRTGFIIAKFLAIASAFLVSAVVIQAAVAYAQLSLANRAFIPIGPFLAATFMVVLAVVFYLSLTLMLGTMFESRVPVMGIPIALVMGQIFVTGLLSSVMEWLPYLLPGNLLQLSVNFVAGTPTGAMWLLTLFSTIGLSALFIYLALKRIHQDEL